MNDDNNDLKRMPENYWKKKLTPEQYRVMREKGTEIPFSDKYINNQDSGMYECAACGNPLFSTSAKFELSSWYPNSGWPSFDQPINKEHVELREDSSHGMQRTEIICKKCGSHLGHLFDDGPQQTTGEHYCVNSCALHFVSKKDK